MPPGLVMVTWPASGARASDHHACQVLDVVHGGALDLGHHSRALDAPDVGRGHLAQVRRAIRGGPGRRHGGRQEQPAQQHRDGQDGGPA
jgi:hypothetical protein